jgi:hypothetical protein
MHEVNTPKQLSVRQQYVNELIAKPTWTRVMPFQDVEGWMPGPNLRKRLVMEEQTALLRDMIENRKRIDQWKSQLLKAKDEEAQKLARMIRRWTEFNAALKQLHQKLQTVF